MADLPPLCRPAAWACLWRSMAMLWLGQGRG